MIKAIYKAIVKISSESTKQDQLDLFNPFGAKTFAQVIIRYLKGFAAEGRTDAEYFARIINESNQVRHTGIIASIAMDKGVDQWLLMLNKERFIKNAVNANEEFAILLLLENEEIKNTLDQEKQQTSLQVLKSVINGFKKELFKYWAIVVAVDGKENIIHCIILKFK